MRKIFITGGSGFIGTNLVSALEGDGVEIANFDHSPPYLDEHRVHWKQGDIMDAGSLQAAMQAFAPGEVIHLAARVDCDENTTVENDYALNTRGTANLLAAVKHCPSVERLVVTSTQFVCGPGRLPSGDTDFFPHTVYGQSKVITEELTRGADLDCAWTIVRPTNVWGEWHARYTGEFWKVLDRGLYFHPDVPSPTRSYGYVGNLVWQLMKILELPTDQAHQKIVYLGDRPINIRHWIESFHRQITGRAKLRSIPFWLLRGVAGVGDLIGGVTRKPFYINSSRLRSMTTDYLTPMDPTFELLGEPPFSLDEGVARTVAWFRSPGRERVLAKA